MVAEIPVTCGMAVVKIKCVFQNSKVLRDFQIIEE